MRRREIRAALQPTHAAWHAALLDAGKARSDLKPMRALLVGLLLASYVLAGSAEPPPPGHSMHGEAFNEGPRQAAVLMPGTGDVHFPITTKAELAQKFFDQGVGQLHGFWYFEAERSFRQVAALDPDCAIAFWGMAMANLNNPRRAVEFIKKAAASKEKASRREQLWIGAWADYYAEAKKEDKERRSALIRALEELTYEFPDDLEAKAFLVFQLWENKNHGVPIASRKAVDALARQVLAVQPMHPVHHYLIHLWNSGSGDKQALEAAARCGQAVPAIAHMWHMPSHTFSNLRRYADAAWHQEASARVDHAYLIARGVLPDQIHNFAHNNDWLVKNLGYIGRVHDAMDLAKNMIELPRPGSKNGRSYQMGRERLLEILLQFERWDEIAALEGTIYFATFEQPVEEVKRRRVQGLARFAQGERARGEEQLAALQAMREKARTERIAAADRAEAEGKKSKKTDEQIAKAMADALRGFSYQLAQTESAIAELRLARALLEGDRDAAKKELAQAKDISAARLARIHFQLGNEEAALKLARDASTPDEAQVQPLANLADLLWRCGKKEEALATFQKLRALSAQLDLDCPAFARLAPLAAELQLPSDWREPLVTRPDVGSRPPLAALGPFRWRPSRAPAWSLPNAEGNRVSLADFAGRPLLVVFYLGSGCVHCIEQLNVFAPMHQEFADAGLRIVAISTDSAEGLHATVAKAKDASGFPFPIVSDATLETFKAWRAFDDFEKIPLHGTFLIDGDGLVRWQDISYQPFRDAKWLLGEARRLLSISALKAATAGR